MPSVFAPFLLLAADAVPAAPADGKGAADAPSPGFFGNPLLLFALIFFIIWFVVIRPQSKDRKKREQDLKAVRKYDKVITNAGIHATVMSVGDTDVVLRIDDKNDVRIRVEKTALWQIKPSETESSETGPDDDSAPEPEEKATEKGKA